MILKVLPAGQTPPKTEKRAIESIVYVLDCSSLLDFAELITKVDTPQSQNDIQLSDVRSRLGRNIEIRVENPPLTTSQYLDYTIPVVFYTTEENKKVAIFHLRVHR